MQLPGPVAGGVAAWSGPVWFKVRGAGAGLNLGYDGVDSLVVVDSQHAMETFVKNEVCSLQRYGMRSSLPLESLAASCQTLNCNSSRTECADCSKRLKVHEALQCCMICELEQTQLCSAKVNVFSMRLLFSLDVFAHGHGQVTNALKSGEPLCGAGPA